MIEDQNAEIEHLRFLAGKSIRKEEVIGSVLALLDFMESSNTHEKECKECRFKVPTILTCPFGHALRLAVKSQHMIVKLKLDVVGQA